VIAALVGVLAFGVGGYVALEGWSFLDALYMTVLTLTTVGFREIRPLDTSGEIFTMILILMGVGLALVAVSLIARLVADPAAGARSRRRRMQRQIDGLHDHTIICAYGRVGRAVARELTRASAPFLVIDPKEELTERMAEDGVLFLIDDPSSEAVLRTAGVDRARSLVCAVDSDATNVYITLIARSLRPDLTIVARASEPGSPERLERAGADRVVSPFVTSGRHMATMAMRPEVVDVVADEDVADRPAIAVEEQVVGPGSPLVGAAVDAAGVPVLALRRADGAVVASPSPDTLVRAGDTVLLLRGASRGGRRRPGAKGRGSGPSGPGTPPR
jgi:voltage-gated potassium channel